MNGEVVFAQTYFSGILCSYVGTGVTVMKFGTENSGAPLVLFLVPVVSLMLTVCTV